MSNEWHVDGIEVDTNKLILDVRPCYGNRKREGKLEFFLTPEKRKMLLERLAAVERLDEVEEIVEDRIEAIKDECKLIYSQKKRELAAELGLEIGDMLRIQRFDGWYVDEATGE